MNSISAKGIFNETVCTLNPKKTAVNSILVEMNGTLSSLTNATVSNGLLNNYY
jgi:hypothetical protein